MIFDVNAWLGSWPFRALQDNTPETLVARLDRSGITAAAVSSIEAVFHRNVQPANERLARSVAPFSDRLVPLATINPAYVKWEDDLRVCHEELGMKGVRLIPQYHGYEIDGPEAKRLAAACRERGLSISVPHRMEDARQRHWMDPGRMVDLNRVANLIAAVPNVTVLVLNARMIARTPLWLRQDVREKPWYVDLSLAEIHYVLHRDVRHKQDMMDLIEQGGTGHIVFGTHLPFSYAGAALVKRAVLPVDAQTLHEISYGRAAKIFGLSTQAASTASAAS